MPKRLSPPNEILVTTTQPTDQNILWVDPSDTSQASAGGGVTSHSSLTNLSADDHTQYYNQTRGDARYALISHSHTASQISDSTTTGRSVLTATDAAAARTAIGAGTSNLAIGTTSTTAKAGDYQPTAANISDSTTTGRSVLTATDAAAARTAIGAGTSNLALGTTSTTAKAGDYQPTAANISDSTTTGRAVITATDAPAARTAIGLNTSGMGVVVHGTDAAVARPAGYAVVTWIGTVQPTNAVTNDIWYNG